MAGPGQGKAVFYRRDDRAEQLGPGQRPEPVRCLAQGRDAAGRGNGARTDDGSHAAAVFNEDLYASRTQSLPRETESGRGGIAVDHNGRPVRRPNGHEPSAAETADARFGIHRSQRSGYGGIHSISAAFGNRRAGIGSEL